MPEKGDSTQPTIKPISPLAATNTNGRKTDSDHTGGRRRLKISALLGSLFMLVAGGAWLLYFLSQNPLQTQTITEVPAKGPVNTSKQPAAQPPRQPAAGVTPEQNQSAAAIAPAQNQHVAVVPPEQAARAKETAEQKLAEYVDASSKLNGRGVADWGDSLYTEMTELAERADAAFLDKRYNIAAQDYTRAQSTAEALAGRSGQALNRLLDEGQAALDTGDGSVAQQKFATALLIDPANPVARRGLQRAETIETVTALMESGSGHEASGDLLLAAADYQKAIELDAFAREARGALEKINARIREAQFQQLVSDGLTALHSNNYALARSKLGRAKSLKPNSPEVRDALLQVDQAIRLARIDALQRQALAAEKTENWQRALTAYQAVLDTDNNVQFASRGKKRAAEQIRVAKRLDFFLARPEVRESDSQLKNAVLLLNEARDVEPQGPKLAERIARLQRLVDIAGMPVSVTIESDKHTDVAVYKVGRLGRFEVRELKLRPGTYTIVGSRDGYQDVRQKIMVKPGRQPIRVTVICRVKI